MMLVSLQEASDWVKRDTTADDAKLTIIVHAASASVLDYIGDAKDAFTDSAGDVLVDSAGDALGVPDRIRAATLFMVEYMYNNADGSIENPVPEQFGYGYLPQGVIAMLYSYRKPTVV